MGHKAPVHGAYYSMLIHVNPYSKKVLNRGKIHPLNFVLDDDRKGEDNMSVKWLTW